LFHHLSFEQGVIVKVVVEPQAYDDHTRVKIPLLHLFIDQDAMVDEIDPRQIQKIGISVRAKVDEMGVGLDQRHVDGLVEFLVMPADHAYLELFFQLA